MTDIVLQSLDNGLLTITMNRPDRRNALNPDMTQGLVEAARRAAEDHVIVHEVLPLLLLVVVVRAKAGTHNPGRQLLPRPASVQNDRPRRGSPLFAGTTRRGYSILNRASG